MVRLERLRAGHAQSLLAFERENREFFARSVPDRGDAYFAEFAARHQALLDEQDCGTIHFHLVLDERGALVGRANLVDVQDGTAEVGYRVGARAAGRGVATAAVAELCRLAAASYGLSSLTAVTTLDNPASAAVLRKNRFGAVEEITLDGQPGVRYLRRLGGSDPVG
ncbi:GNAT family N-acetyltransferase [Streptomyces sp. NPDC060028]|uniref:GNAT family N-acetyltransferase n=1 Tax=Streptomyces sp. NPDC060028 TaxID=3347041 RepID=UPI003691BC2A